MNISMDAIRESAISTIKAAIAKTPSKQYIWVMCNGERWIIDYDKERDIYWLYTHFRKEEDMRVNLRIFDDCSTEMLADIATKCLINHTEYKVVVEIETKAFDSYTNRMVDCQIASTEVEAKKLAEEMVTDRIGWLTEIYESYSVKKIITKQVASQREFEVDIFQRILRGEADYDYYKAIEIYNSRY